MRNGFKIVDTEIHLVEPTDLWANNLPEPYRSQTRVISGKDGKSQNTGKRFELGGKVMGTQLDPNEWELLVRKQGRRRLTEEPRLLDAVKHCIPSVYLEGMDAEGIDVALLMPTLTFQATTWDDLAPDHALAMCRVYNDFVHTFTKASPSRLKFWAWLPRQSPELAAQEARRCVEELGAIGAALPMRAVNGHLLSDDIFTPLWKEMTRLGKPIAFHVGGSPVSDDLRQRYRGRRHGAIIGRTMIRQFYASTSVAELILGGVLEDYPDMQVMIQEAAVSWLPWLLWNMDELYEMYEPDLDFTLSIKPSEYFRRQCYAVVDCGEDIVKLTIDYGLLDNLVISTDYPHHDCMFPEAINTFLGHRGINEEAMRKILWDNAARLFALEEVAV
jgi:uncharacterized protein